MVLKDRVGVEPEDTSRWMVSYADFTTVLLAVFITLFAVTTASTKKPQINTSVNYSSNIPNKVSDYSTDRLKVDLTRIFKSELANNHIRLIPLSNGIRLEIMDSVLFEEGSANISAESEETLLLLFSNLYDNRYLLQIEGHTDDKPIHSEKFASNWELSALRATAVLKYLEDLGISDSRLSAVGYGASKPLLGESKDSPLNRRVTILIKKE